jgi:hypothetical protein
MTDFIGIETYYDNGETGTTWFFNDMDMEHEELLHFLNHVTNHEDHEITTDEDAQFIVLKNIVRNKEIHFNTYGCFLRGANDSDYPYMYDGMSKEEIIGNGMKPISLLVRNLVLFLD